MYKRQAEQIEKIRIQLGFDKPLLVQYGRWVWDLLHFDLRISLANGHDVWTDIALSLIHILKPIFYEYVKEKNLQQVAYGIYVSEDTWIDAVSYTHLRSLQKQPRYRYGTL